MKNKYQYPLKMDRKQKEKLQKIAKKERRSFNQTILLLIDKFLKSNPKLKEGNRTENGSQ